MDAVGLFAYCKVITEVFATFHRFKRLGFADHSVYTVPLERHLVAH